jgi:hypothetical protein
MGNPCPPELFDVQPTLRPVLTDFPNYRDHAIGQVLELAGVSVLYDHDQKDGGLGHLREGHPFELFSRGESIVGIIGDVNVSLDDCIPRVQDDQCRRGGRGLAPSLQHFGGQEQGAQTVGRGFRLDQFSGRLERPRGGTEVGPARGHVNDRELTGLGEPAKAGDIELEAGAGDSTRNVDSRPGKRFENGEGKQRFPCARCPTDYQGLGRRAIQEGRQLCREVDCSPQELGSAG